jgi:hypothetical protein
LLRRYIDAYQCGHLAELAVVLREDARVVMPPYLEWYDGPASIVSFAQAFSDPGTSGFRGELRGVPHRPTDSPRSRGIRRGRCVGQQDESRYSPERRPLKTTSPHPLASRPGVGSKFRDGRLADETTDQMLLELPALGRRQLAAARRLHPTGRTCRGLRSFRGHSFHL